MKTFALSAVLGITSFGTQAQGALIDNTSILYQQHTGEIDLIKNSTDTFTQNINIQTSTDSEYPYLSTTAQEDEGQTATFTVSGESKLERAIQDEVTPLSVNLSALGDEISVYAKPDETVYFGTDNSRVLSLDTPNIPISPMEREKFVSEQSELTNLREGIDNLATNVENTLSRNSKFINSLRISALSPTERGTSDSRVLSLDAPNTLRHAEFISASNNSNILTGTENQINVTSNNGLILKQVQDDEKYRNDMGTQTGFAAGGKLSLPSGENTDVSKLVYSAAVSEGSDNYSSLRVNI